MVTHLIYLTHPRNSQFFLREQAQQFIFISSVWIVDRIIVTEDSANGSRVAKALIDVDELETLVGFAEKTWKMGNWRSFEVRWTSNSITIFPPLTPWLLYQKFPRIQHLQIQSTKSLEWNLQTGFSAVQFGWCVEELGSFYDWLLLVLICCSRCWKLKDLRWYQQQE